VLDHVVGKIATNQCNVCCGDNCDKHRTVQLYCSSCMVASTCSVPEGLQLSCR
jgi:hypothetical protein